MIATALFGDGAGPRCAFLGQYKTSFFAEFGRSRSSELDRLVKQFSVNTLQLVACNHINN
jgi:hypothetical protein